MGHEYEVISAAGVTWDEARAAALGLGDGWDLVTIGSADENDFVESLLDTGQQDRSHYWIGATDSAVEGVWQWVDLTPFLFTDWWGFEPNDLGGEDHLAYDLRNSAWAWNDAAPNAFTLPLVQGYVAEREVPREPVPEPASLSLVALGTVAAFGTRRRRTRT